MHSEATVNERAFAEGLSFYKMTWVFITGSIIGTYYEQILTLFKLGVWENRSAVFLGPFNPLYGAAFVLVVYLLYRIDSFVIAVFVGAIFGGSFEYMANLAQEFFTGSVSWDYSNLPLNIHGRTTIHYALFWGLIAAVMVKYVYPFVSTFIENMSPRMGTALTKTLIVFLSINMFITYSALIRQGLRHRGVDAFTPIGEVYDQVFTDNYIQEKFPNMHLIVDDTNE